jgi:hypothetical protein
MNKQAYVEEKEIVVKEFLWVDGEFRCSSGELLSVLHKLSCAEPCEITNQNIVDYLASKQLIAEGEKGYAVAEGKAMACETLGNTVSRAIDKALSRLGPGDDLTYITHI